MSTSWSERRAGAVASALVVLALSGCAGGDEEALRGVDWRLVAVSAESEPVPLPPGVSGSLRFGEEGEWTGRVCNTASGRVEVGPDEIRLLREVVATAMACPRDEQRVERSVLGILTGGATVSWELTDQRLTIEAEDGDRLVYRAGR